MLLATLLLAGHLLPAAPAQTAPPDTTRLVRGLLGQQFAWGTLVLRDGQRLQGYLLASAPITEGMVPYYEQAPDAQPRGRVRYVNLSKVLAMRIKSQRYEAIRPTRRGEWQLAARRQTGAAELLLTQAAVPVPALLGATPVMGLPHSTGSAVLEAWYLRRPSGELQAVTPDSYRQVLATFLADAPELAAQVAAGAPGYGFADLESVVQRYNELKANK